MVTYTDLARRNDTRFDKPPPVTRFPGDDGGEAIFVLSITFSGNDTQTDQYCDVHYVRMLFEVKETNGLI